MVRTSEAMAAHAHLRAATREEHAAAEATPVMRALLAGDLDMAGYIRLLQGQLRLHAAWENARRGWLEGDLQRHGWHYVPRRPLLESDLATLGASARDDEAAVFGDVPVAACWGELYVIEGSALGGRMIARHLAEHWPAWPRCFFRCGEDASRGSWPAFQHLLDRRLSDVDDQRNAIDAARGMFAYFHHMLECLTHA